MLCLWLSFSHPSPLSLPSIYTWNCHSAIDAHYLCHLGLLSVALIQPFISTLSLPSMLHVELSFSHRCPLSLPSRVVECSSHSAIHIHSLSLPSMLHVELSFSHRYPLSLPSRVVSVALIQPFTSTLSLPLPSMLHVELSFSHRYPLSLPSRVVSVALIQPFTSTLSLSLSAIYVTCGTVIQPSIPTLSAI